jgi:mannitol/fructose-specific phosphotransferase system IIA component (Ntr-type)
MRESEIEAYDPGFKSPFYPWMQIAGFFISAFLIAEMGFISIVFTLMVITVSIIWFFYYAKDNVKRQGAIFHVSARFGKYQYDELEREMRGIIREKGLRKEDPYEKAIGRSIVIDIEDDSDFIEITRMVSERLAGRVDISPGSIFDYFLEDSTEGALPVGNATALKHIRIDKDIDTEIVLVRIRSGIDLDRQKFEPLSEEEDVAEGKLHCLVFMISSSSKSGQHLRILAHLAEMIDSSDFFERWMHAVDEAELREILLRDERFINITLKQDYITRGLIDKKVKDLELPGESLITIIKRKGRIIFPHGDTVLKENDELSIIGEKTDIDEIKSIFYDNSKDN